MNCTTLNGINNSNCTLSIGGISKVFIFPFKDISQYTYTNDNLNYITGYSSLVLPAVYKPNSESSEYTGNKSERNFKLYDHQLTLNFLKMDRFKRDEIRKLEHLDLTIIFQDRNNKCWLMGQDVPVRLNTNQIGTGVKDGVNGYELTLISKEKQQLREVVCPSEGCFSSFTATEYRRTTFVIPNSGDYGWDYLETDVNGTLVTMNLSLPGTQALDPSDWNNDPLVLTHDRQILLQLFTSANGVVNNLITTYDDNTDTTTISIDSNSTSYGTLQIDNTVFNKDSFLATLNLTTILSTGISNPTTIIEVRDSLNNIVYSGGYSTSIANGTTLQGTTNNATLVMSSLYPNGTTLTVQLTNVPCSDVVYTYNYINTLEACTLERTYDFSKDKRCKLTVPYLTNGGVSPITQRYQNLTINIFGVSFQLYKNYTDWHDDFNTFVNDITLKFYQANLPIDLNTLIFTDNLTGVDIEFDLIDNTSNYFFRQQMIGFESELLNYNWIQGRNLNLTTIAPLGSTVTHEDIYSHQMVGDNLINITSNNFDLGYNTFGNTSIDNVSILWNFNNLTPYEGISVINTSTIGGNCNTPNINEGFIKCFEDFNSSYTDSFELITLDASPPLSINMGNSFTLIYNNGFGNTTLNINSPSSITPNNNIHYLLNGINSVRGLQVVHYDFDILSREYRIFLKMETGLSLISLQETTSNRFFNLGAISTLHTNTTTTNINPFNELSWTLPTYLISSPTSLLDLTQGYWQMLDTYTQAISFDYSTGSDDFNISKTNGIDNQITISFHEDYPNTSNQVLFESLFGGISNSTISSLSSKLISNGSNVNSVNYISYTNNLGWRQVQAIDLTTSLEGSFNELVQTPIIWGVVDNMEYVGSQTLVAPSVSGIPGCS